MSSRPLLIADHMEDAVSLESVDADSAVEAVEAAEDAVESEDG